MCDSVWPNQTPEMDWLVRPLACHPDGTPLSCFSVTAFSRGGKDRVQLCEVELFNRILLVYKKGNRVRLARRAITSSRHTDRIGSIAELFLELLLLGWQHLARHRT